MAVKPYTVKSDPSIKTSLPCDLGGYVIQLLPASDPLKAYESTVTTAASTTYTLNTNTSLVCLNPKDNGVWWKWGDTCAGSTDNMHGFAHADQPTHLVKPAGTTKITVIARTGNSALTLSEY